MAKRMLIDATHAEETRVVVVDGKTLEEFDFETSTKQQLKGNIYLAKVTRVEPSLQAAFVDYGGNRHGFLAFSEIHPDYYQIPVADREALIKQQREQADGDNQSEPEDDKPAQEDGDGAAIGEPDDGGAGVDPVETVSGQEEEEIARRPTVLPRYRIQEVIKRRQILLVQVVKEERGTKGAALTTYMSLAGRYCVLMPNTTRGGGISRKIQSGEARKRLRSVINALSVPEGMAVILRTAGKERKKSEIKRDFDYLVRLWDQIRETTLGSTAPALIHEEANLIKRSIRDLYSSDIEEVLVDGDAGYKVAKSFMRTLMPSHAKRVQPYRDRLPLYTRHYVDAQLDTMHSATVQLPSGGYIVISPTEALVAIDVNSGRATRERNIEETATATNLEAAAEVARQLRLRDLAGLIVIDFIDMEEQRNARAVERKLKDAVHSDRARIQMGRISSFGLLELSRQRLRPSLLEASSQDCAHCAGTGKVRSVESAALHALRVIEEEGARGRSAVIAATMPAAVALYLLNMKRETLGEVEQRYNIQIRIVTDTSAGPPETRIETIEPRSPDAASEPTAAPAETAAEAVEKPRKRRGRRRQPSEEREKATDDAPPRDAEAADAEPEQTKAESDGTETERGSRRRRGRRGGRKRTRARATQAEEAATDGASDGEVAEGGAGEGRLGPQSERSVEPAATIPDTPDGDLPKPRRGRRARKQAAKAGDGTQPAAEAVVEESTRAEPTGISAKEDAPPKAKRRPRRRRSPSAPSRARDAAQQSAGPANRGGNGDTPAPHPEAAALHGNGDDPSASGAAPTEPLLEGDAARSPRRGWWQRITGA